MVDRTAQTARLRLEPLARHHAEEMAEVLRSPALYRHIGGTPPTPIELDARFVRLAAGSPDPDVEWRNWVVRRRSDGQAVGWVQATLSGDAGQRADVAWVVGEPWQGRGFATEAASWLLDEVARLGALMVVASISPANDASASVASRLGMTRGGRGVDGELEWFRELEAPA